MSTSATRFLFMLLVLFSLNVIGDPREVKTVLVEGLGKDVSEASVNAAKNALLNVVGGFLESSEILEKKLVIDGALKEESSKINKDIKEYSQGSIQTFQIVDVTEDNGFVRIRAQVSVRNDDLEKYVKSKIAGGVAVNGMELYAQTTNKLQQKEGLGKILTDDLIRPVFQGDVVEFSISKPTPISHEPSTPNWRFKEYLSSLNDKIGERFQTSNLLQVKVKASLNPSFFKKSLKTLSEISDPHEANTTIYPLLYTFGVSPPLELFPIFKNKEGTNKLNENDVVFIVNFGFSTKGFVATPSIAAIDNIFTKSYAYIFEGVSAAIRDSISTEAYTGARKGTRLILSLHDSGGNTIAEMECDNIENKQAACFSEAIDLSAIELVGNDSFVYKPWRLIDISPNNTGYPQQVIIFAERYFNLTFYVDTPIIKDVAGLRLSLKL